MTLKTIADLLFAGCVVVAALALAGVWAKWRFDPRRLPVLPFVPFVLAISLIEGHLRASRLRASR